MVAMLHKHTTHTAREVMTPPLTLLSAELSVEAAGRMLAMGGAVSAPVVDEHGRLIGVFSVADCFRNRMERPVRTGVATADECMCQPWAIPAESSQCVCKVRDVMCRESTAIAMPEDSLDDIAETMIRMQVHKVIVVDADQRPVGAVTSLDVLAASRDETAPPGGPHFPLKG